MTENQLAEIFQVQQDYDEKRITFQEFKDRCIVKIIAYSTVQDIEDIVSYILNN